MKSAFKSLSALLFLASLSTWGFCGLANEVSAIAVKSESLRQLQELRAQNSRRLQELDLALNKKFEETKLVNLAEDVETIRAEKHEHVLRQDFLNRLIFQLDTKFAGGDLRQFLQVALIEMAKVDAQSSANAADGLYVFLRYSADAIKRLPEHKENVLAFLEGYMNLSIANPILPEDYLASRNYTNGSRFEQGHPMNRDEVGAIADRRLMQQEASGAVRPAVPVSEKR